MEISLIIAVIIAILILGIVLTRRPKSYDTNAHAGFVTHYDSREHGGEHVEPKPDDEEHEDRKEVQ